MPSGVARCVLCQQSEEDSITGPLATKEDVTAHHNCLLYASGIYCVNSPLFDDLFGFSVEDVRKEKRRGKRLRCVECKLPGATAGCEVKRCSSSFHLPCAVLADAHLQAEHNTGLYHLYCKKHWARLKERAQNGGEHSAREEVMTPARQEMRSTARQEMRSPASDEVISGSGRKKRRILESDEECEDLMAPEDLIAPLEDSDLELIEESEERPERTTGANGANTEMCSIGVDGDITDISDDDVSESLLPHHRPQSQVHTAGSAASAGSSAPVTRVAGSDGPAGPAAGSDGPAAGSAVAGVAGSTAAGPGPLQGSGSSGAGGGSVPVAGSGSGSSGAGGGGGSVPIASSGSGSGSASEFWSVCRAAGWTEEIFRRIVEDITRLRNRIHTHTANTHDCETALRVLELLGNSEEILEHLQQECEETDRRLQLKREALKLARGTLSHTHS